jgi:tetratricopeptide (TPR) repeat protein
MIEALDLDGEHALTTDGEIAVINLESGRRRSWTRFWATPLREGVAEAVLEQEQLTVQFVGDLSALDRLDSLGRQLAEMDAESARTALIQAQVASMTHRFAEAARYLADADRLGAAQSEISRLMLNIDQACGVDLDKVREQRRAMAEKSDRLEDLVPLGSLLGDLREFSEADHVYRRALRVYRDVSPFPIAGVCFHLGMLWGELVPQPQVNRAAQWYRRAIDCLPGYAKARVHLAEIYSTCGRASDAEALLMPATASGDPEVHWRLADAMASQGKLAEAEAQMETARSGFETVLARHLLAFADHGAEFYAGSGINLRKALDLARINLANRPTLRAFEQAHAIAIRAGDADARADLLAKANEHWGATAAFRSSPLSEVHVRMREGAVA